MDNIKVFSTPILDGVKIAEYKDMVIIRNVRAMSIIHDMLTRVRDIVGGQSGSYKKLMKTMEDEVMTEAREKAAELGANAIVGFKLDFDSIEGLLMATGQGMAVILEG